MLSHASANAQKMRRKRSNTGSSRKIGMKARRARTHNMQGAHATSQRVLGSHSSLSGGLSSDDDDDPHKRKRRSSTGSFRLSAEEQAELRYEIEHGDLDHGVDELGNRNYSTRSEPRRASGGPASPPHFERQRRADESSDRPRSSFPVMKTGKEVRNPLESSGIELSTKEDLGVGGGLSRGDAQSLKERARAATSNVVSAGEGLATKGSRIIGKFSMLARAQKASVDQEKNFESEIYLARAAERARAQSMCVMHPSSIGHVAWDLFVCMIIVYNIVVTPMQQAFFPHHVPSFLVALNDLSDAIFIADIVVHFRTALVITDRGKPVTVYESSVIAKHYIERTLLIDLCSIGVPFGLLSHVEASPGVLRVLSMLPFIKILRVFKLNTLLVRLWQPRPEIAKGILLIKLLVTTLTAAHVFGCIYYIVGTDENGLPYADSWVVAAGLQNSGTRAHYMSGMYFALMTLTTVGYGDISASNTTEMIYVSFLMLVGAMMFAFIMGMTTGAVEELMETNGPLIEVTEVVEQFVRVYHLERVDPGIGRAIKRTLTYQWNLSRSFQLEQALCILPDALRMRMLVALHRPVLARVPFFAECEETFLQPIIGALRLQVCLEDTTIMEAGELTSSMFFLREGSVKAMALVNTLVVNRFDSGDYFGELGVLMDLARSPVTLKSCELCEFYILDRDNLMPVLDHFKHVRMQMMVIAITRLKERYNRMQLGAGLMSAAEVKEREKWGMTLVVNLIQAVRLQKDARRSLARRNRSRRRSLEETKETGGRDGDSPRHSSFNDSLKSIASMASMSRIVLGDPQIDAYASVMLGDAPKPPTPIKYDSANPVWNTSYSFNFSDFRPLQKELEVGTGGVISVRNIRAPGSAFDTDQDVSERPLILSVHHRDQFRGDHVIGQVVVPWTELLEDARNAVKSRGQDVAGLTSAVPWEGWFELHTPIVPCVNYGEPVTNSIKSAAATALQASSDVLRSSLHAVEEAAEIAHTGKHDADGSGPARPQRAKSSSSSGVWKQQTPTTHSHYEDHPENHALLGPLHRHNDSESGGYKPREMGKHSTTKRKGSFAGKSRRRASAASDKPIFSLTHENDKGPVHLEALEKRKELTRRGLVNVRILMKPTTLTIRKQLALTKSLHTELLLQIPSQRRAARKLSALKLQKRWRKFTKKEYTPEKPLSPRVVTTSVADTRPLVDPAKTRPADAGGGGGGGGGGQQAYHEMVQASHQRMMESHAAAMSDMAARHEKTLTRVNNLERNITRILVSLEGQLDKKEYSRRK